MNRQVKINLIRQGLQNEKKTFIHIDGMYKQWPYGKTFTDEEFKEKKYRNTDIIEFEEIKTYEHE